MFHHVVGVALIGAVRARGEVRLMSGDTVAARRAAERVARLRGR